MRKWTLCFGARHRSLEWIMTEQIIEKITTAELETKSKLSVEIWQQKF